jgi:hypothetical protein
MNFYLRVPKGNEIPLFMHNFLRISFIFRLEEMLIRLLFLDFLIQA